MGNDKMFGSVLSFLCFLVAFGYAHENSHIHRLVLSASLVKDAAQENFQKVVMRCSTANVSSHLNSSHIDMFGSSNSLVQPQSNEKEFWSELELLMNGSYWSSNFSDLVNYTSTKMENESIQATFFLQKTRPFSGYFTCRHVNKTKNSTSVISSEELAFVYVPYSVPCQCTESTWKYLAVVLIFLLLTVILVLVILVALVKYGVKIDRCHKKDDVVKEISPRAFVNTTDLSSSYSFSDLPKQKQLQSFCSESCHSQEEATNALLLYLAHPTPCLEDSCPCIQYKQILDEYKWKSSKSIKRARLVSSMVSRDDVATDNDGIRHSVLLPNSTTYDKTSSSRPPKEHIIVYPELNSPLLMSPTSLSNSDGSDYFVAPPDIFEVSSYGGCYSNEDHQVYLHVQEGSIPVGKTIEIKIGISMNSSLIPLLPPENLPVSPIVSFHVVGEDNFEFLKPVEIILPHFVDIEDEEDAKAIELTFLKSSCNLYCFHQSKGVATFRPKSHTASLMTTHFCSFCIVANKKISVDKMHYRLVKVVPRNQQVEWWRARFCVTYYLRTCLEVLKKYYPEDTHEIKSIKRFKFPKSEYISIHLERKLAGGWQLALETNEKLYAKKVEYWSVEPDELEEMEEDGLYPPCFEVLVSSSLARESVTAHISFKGVMEDDGSNDGVQTELVLQPPIMSPVRHQRNDLGYSSMTSSCSMPAIQVTKTPVQPRHIQLSPLKLGPCPSHSKLMNLVAAPLPTKWRLVGIQLGLSTATLDEIESSHHMDCKRCFSAMFSEWKKQGTSPYLWTTIIEALKSSSVLENVAANEIAESLANPDSMSLGSNSTTCSSGYQSISQLNNSPILSHFYAGDTSTLDESLV